MRPVFIYLVSLFGTLLIGSAIDVWVLGHSEGAIGTPWDNMVLNAALMLPLAGLGALGFSFSRGRSTQAHRLTSQLAGMATGLAVFAWALIAPDLQYPVVMLAIYCIAVAFLSGLITSRLLSGGRR